MCTININIIQTTFSYISIDIGEAERDLVSLASIVVLVEGSELVIRVDGESLLAVNTVHIVAAVETFNEVVVPVGKGGGKIVALVTNRDPGRRAILGRDGDGGDSWGDGQESRQHGGRN